jgi:hypothetical protein
MWQGLVYVLSGLQIGNSYFDHRKSRIADIANTGFLVPKNYLSLTLMW